MLRQVRRREAELGRMFPHTRRHVATGAYEDVDDAIAHMVKIGARYLPNATLKDLYDRKYALYRKTVACLEDLWDEMGAFTRI